MTKEYFFNFKETGALKLDKVIFESYYPILFTCKNESNGKLYLCVCSQADSKQKKWLIKEVTLQTVIDLLSDKITIRDAFLINQGAKYTVIYDMNEQTRSIEEDNKEDWNAEESIDLPTAGEYLDVEDDEFKEEIRYFENMRLYQTDQSKMKFSMSFSVSTSLRKHVPESLYRNEGFIDSYQENLIVPSGVENTRDICLQDAINMRLEAS